ERPPVPLAENDQLEAHAGVSDVEQTRVVRHSLALALAAILERLANGDDAYPTEERAAPGVLGELRRTVGTPDEELLTHALHDVIDGDVSTAASALDRRPHRLDEVLVERRDRPGVSIETAEREIQISKLKRLDRRPVSGCQRRRQRREKGLLRDRARR